MTDPDQDPLATTLDRLYREMFAAGTRAGKSKRPEVRDAWFAAAALVAREALAHGVTISERQDG